VSQGSMQATDTGREGAASSGPNRTLVISVVLTLVLAAALFIVILNAGGPAPDAVESPESWSDIQDGDQAAASSVDLGVGNRSVTVIVGAQEKTCWAGFIVSEEIEGCGRVVYDVTGAGRNLGANVRSLAETKAFVGLAVWNERGTSLLESGVTRKKLGVVAFTAYPEPPDAH
jgi:hypothetical protein